MALSPVGIEMPADADCNGCHMTGTGTVGTKPIPVMGHPLSGWRDCTACHTMGSLVKTAPGHIEPAQGRLPDLPPDPRRGRRERQRRRCAPEHMGADKPCTACHGVDDHAPLPESMNGRGDNCWICHNGPEFTYLFEESRRRAAPARRRDAAREPAPETSALRAGCGRPESR